MRDPERLPGSPDLPPGVSQSDIDGPRDIERGPLSSREIAIADQDEGEMQ
jgi:hypothetical protein